MSAGLRQSLLGRFSISLTLSALATLLAPAHAGTINVINGGFEQTTIAGSSGIGSVYQSNGVDVDDVTGWTTNGYNYVFAPGQTSATGQYGALSLWGPIPVSPLGGNYVAMDGAFEVGALSQTLYGLTPGQATTVSFYYAGAQQQGFNGATTEAFTVSLGTASQETPILTDTSHGFTGWQAESLTFTPYATSEVLSFLAIGTPNGVPPMSLLDGVSVSTAPEPNSLILMATGLAGLGGYVRSRFRKTTL